MDNRVKYYIFKKYYILNLESVPTIVEIDFDNKNFGYVRFLFYYHKNKVEKNKKQIQKHQFSRITIEKLTLFKSNDLNECIEKLPIILDIKKYNL